MVTQWNSNRSLWRRTVEIIIIDLTEKMDYMGSSSRGPGLSFWMSIPGLHTPQIQKLKVGAKLHKLHFYIASLICFSWDKTYTIKFTQSQCTNQWAVINLYSHVTIPKGSLVPFASTSSSPASGNHLPIFCHYIFAFSRLLYKWNYTVCNLCFFWMRWFRVVAWIGTSFF